MAPEYPLELVSPRRVVLVFAVVIGVTLLTAAATSPVAFAAFNPQWDGLSDARTQVAQTLPAGTAPVVTNASEYESLAGDETLVMIVAPRSRYSSGDVARLRGFLDRGGTILVAEDFRVETNRLLAALDAEARVDGRLLRDERHYYESKNNTVARNVTNASLVSRTQNITLNRGTALQPGNATVAVQTSPFAYLDTNQDNELNDNETAQRYPVVTVANVSAGRVIVVSDASVFINLMLEQPGNRALLTDMLTAHDRAYFDVSHSGGVPPLIALLITIQTRPWLQGMVALTGMLGLIGAARYREAIIAEWRRRISSEAASPPGLSPAEIRAIVETRHPDWDADQVDRIVTSITRTRETSRTRSGERNDG